MRYKVKDENLVFNPSPEDAEFNENLEQILEVIERHAPGKGKQIVVELCDRFESIPVYFPKKENLYCTVRENWVRERYDEGYDPAHIALAVRRGVRQVWTILGRLPGEDRQMNLFEGWGKK